MIRSLKRTLLSHNLESPKWSPAEVAVPGCELRHYKAGIWASTVIRGASQKEALRQGFRKLLHYIQGENETDQHPSKYRLSDSPTHPKPSSSPASWKTPYARLDASTNALRWLQQDMWRSLLSFFLPETKIEMTVPVTCLVQPGTTEYKVSFFVPTKHQSSPPEPTDPDVFLEERKGAAIFVRSFGGFASVEKFSKEAKALADTLQKEGQSFHSDFYYTAGYNSPFTLFNRHNEVWYFKKEELEGLWMAKNFLGKIGKLLV
uniref:Heme-binding protein 2-like isoform X2 n=1 Tax=Phascolarctos cinereus TaxID=38626 RepID=A0A6P5J554_PHACI|nr:heme-binding protein 2-like isoform X2 [Phascolarctos cinereus]